jgi:hypothetical protein
MVRLALILITALTTTGPICNAQAVAPADKTADTCTPQPECRALYTDMKPAREHPGLKTGVDDAQEERDKASSCKYPFGC